MKKRIQYIYFAYAVSFIIIVIISIIYLTNFNSLKRSIERTQNNYQVKNLVLKVQANLIEAENNQRGYIISEDKGLLISLSETQKSIFKQIDSLKFLTQENQKQQAVVKKLKEVVSSRFQVLYETINHVSEPQYTLFLKNIEKGKRIMQDFKNVANEIDELETKKLQETTVKRKIQEITASWYLAVILLISIFFQIASFLIIIQAIKRRRIYQKTLENKIKELNISNSEMEQITFVASHDLQEPLRKIRTFGDKLLNNYGANLNEEGKMVLEKMHVASRRMQELLSDLINYSRLLKSEEQLQEVNLKQCCENACMQLRNVIETKNAIIKIDELPVVKGYYKQLNLLFFNLIENALKFSKPNLSPTVNISASTAAVSEFNSLKTFIKVSVSDNGIGFEKEFAKKIFIIFQRLHTQNSTIPGKGIGLAICKRIMINHNGQITADGEPGNGAIFNLYFPGHFAE